eukprot:GCRY01002743.1.p1 GENE.GCRY01002743.1~~GCRY01002743.1.p1  ORF type:complete len:312 (-),score=115.12 GCRY01002743.1:13-948(-)
MPSPREPSPVPQAQYDDAHHQALFDSLLKVQLMRDFLEKHSEEPWFPSSIVGSYVRIGIGSSQGIPVYKIAKIVEVREAKPYTLGSHVVTKSLRLQHASNTKNFQMTYVSNQPFERSEYIEWVESSQRAAQPLPQEEELDKVVIELTLAKKYVYSSSDVTTMLEHRRKLGDKKVNLALEKILCQQEIDVADGEGDTERANELRQKMAHLQSMSEEQRQSQNAKSLGVTSINERNRKLNILAINTKAKLLKDRKKEGEERGEINPFARIRTASREIFSGRKAKADNEDSPTPPPAALPAEPTPKKTGGSLHI